MRAGHCLPPSGPLVAVAWLSLGLVPSCALDDGVVTDQVASESTEAEPVETDAVCTTGTYRCFAAVRTHQEPRRISSYAVPFGFGPPELWAAYDIEPRVVVGKPTVALVLAFGYSALEADLGVYRSQYGLPPCTVANGCLRIVNQRGQTSPLPPDPPADDNWTVETALDVDMVSAACPLCNILVVQADDNVGDGLFVAQNTAVELGATVISNSWGAPEEPDTPASRIAATEAYFNHPGVAIFAAAGDDGYNDGGDGPDYPGTSAHVISVGGTRLLQVTSERGWIETAWSKGGSACSLAIPKPAYQTTSPCEFKATADVAAVGDPATGVAVYNASVGGWIIAGGTSASSPFIAAVFAATGNGAQSSGAFLGANTDKLYDVTIGNNGTCGTMTALCNAGVGWDGPSGYGTPNALALLPPGYVPEEVPGDDGGADGGCSTGTGAGAGMLLGVALLAVRRRRR